MSIPDYQTLMLPLLRLLSDGQEHYLRDVIESLAKEFSLSEEEREELLSSGKQPVFNNRVGWARTYMKKAALIDSTRRGYFQITERGKGVLAEGRSSLDTAYLDQYEEFRAFKDISKRRKSQEQTIEVGLETPRETLDYGYQQIKEELAQELLDQVKSCSPRFFENLVLEVLVKMGYGGSINDAMAVGRSGDQGIDGTIKEDRLGLDMIYVQAKRWDGTTNNVGRPEIQKFVGALEGQKAMKGIFITTADFATSAKDYVQYIGKQVVLIDGQQLAQLMIDFNVGVSTETIYEIKRIDSDYFIEE